MPGDVFELDEGRVIPAFIIYDDGEKVTERTIIPRRLEGKYAPNGKTLWITHVEAFCTLRQSDRRFDYWKIDAVADPETGEMVTRSEWLATLPIIRHLPSNVVKIPDKVEFLPPAQHDIDQAVQRIALLTLVEHLLPQALGTVPDADTYMQGWIAKLQAALKSAGLLDDANTMAGLDVLARAMKAAGPRR